MPYPTLLKLLYSLEAEQCELARMASDPFIKEVHFSIAEQCVSQMNGWSRQSLRCRPNHDGCQSSFLIARLVRLARRTANVRNGSLSAGRFPVIPGG